MQTLYFLGVIIPILENTLIFLALFLIHSILRYKHPLANALKSAIPGTVCLVLLNSLENFTGIGVPLNSANLSISALLGIPGVGIITVLNTLFSM